MIQRPPRSTQSRSSAASDVYKRQKDQDGTLIAVLNASQREAGDGDDTSEDGWPDGAEASASAELVLEEHRTPALVGVLARKRECTQHANKQKWGVPDSCAGVRQPGLLFRLALSDLRRERA